LVGLAQGVLKLWVYNFGDAFPHIFSSPSGKTVHQYRKSYGGPKIVQTSPITMASMVGLGLDRPLGGPKKVHCIFICPSCFGIV